VSSQLQLNISYQTEKERGFKCLINQELEKMDSDKMKITFTSYTETPLFVVELLEVVGKSILKFFYITLFHFSLHQLEIFE
jgi:hypothetical protein